MRPILLAFVTLLLACGRPDRQDVSVAHVLPSAIAQRGPDNLVLRIARGGGGARVYAYPRLDTIVWSAGSAPDPARIMAFDDEAGTIAYIDGKGRPARLDFRQGAAYTVSRATVSGLTSADGNAIFGIVADGSVERYAPGGTWKFKPPVAARALFPQGDGTLLVLGERSQGSVMWRVRPPAASVKDSVVLPSVDRTVRTQVGDRLYLASGAQLIGVRTRTMERTPHLAFDSPVELLAATPSGDRVFIVTKTGKSIEIVDRYREAVSGRIDVGHTITELRVDPLGRYLLARPERMDSAIVIELGTNRVIGMLSTLWRTDLPFVAPDGGIAIAHGPDVIFADGQTLKQRVRVRGGAADFWYAFRWTGFRPRDAALDRPVEFSGPPGDSGVRGDSAPRHDTVPASKNDEGLRRVAPSFIVSFAALLAADKARDLATQIHVGNESARVVSSMRDGATIYRVVMGPYSTHDEAERVGRESKQSFWVYEGAP